MTELTILNSMADPDIETAFDRHVAWGLRQVDLKDSIFEGGVLDLSDEGAMRVLQMAQVRGLAVYCLSTMIGHADIERGAQDFEARFSTPIERAIELGHIFGPQFVRLLAPYTSRRAEIGDTVTYVRDEHPWLVDFYREVIDRLSLAGLGVTIENEVGQCLWASESEIIGFFELLDRDDRVRLTWDIANLWHMGTYPSIEGYERLRPYIGYVHLKGGRSTGRSSELRWASSLADTSWPLGVIGRRVIDDGVSPVLCLNPSHGAIEPGYDYSRIVERDIAFTRATFPDVR